MNHINKFRKMHKVFISVTIVSSLLLCGNVASAYENAPKKGNVTFVHTASVPKSIKIQTTINGQKKSFRQSALYKNGHVLVPLEEVAKPLGFKVTNDGNTYFATKEEITAQIKVDNSTAYINGEPYKLPLKSEKGKETILISINLLDEAFNSTSSYSSKNKTIQIKSYKEVGGIKARYGNHTYGTRNQKEYNALMKIIDERFENYDKYYNEIYLSKSGRNKEDKSELSYLIDYMNGARSTWNGLRLNYSNISDITDEQFYLYYVGLEYGDLVKSGLSKEEIIKLFKLVYVVDDLTEQFTTYDKEDICTAFYDRAGYTTAVVAKVENNIVYPKIVLKFGDTWYSRNIFDYYDKVNLEKDEKNGYRTRIGATRGNNPINESLDFGWYIDF